MTSNQVTILAALIGAVPTILAWLWPRPSPTPSPPKDADSLPKQRPTVGPQPAASESVPGIWWVATALLLVGGVISPYQPLEFAVGLRLVGLLGVSVAFTLVAPAIPVRWLVVLLPIDYLVAYWRLFRGRDKPDHVTAIWFVAGYVLTVLVCTSILATRRRRERRT